MNEKIPDTYLQFMIWQSNIDLEIVNENLKKLRLKLPKYLPEDYYFRDKE